MLLKYHCDSRAKNDTPPGGAETRVLERGRHLRTKAITDAPLTVNDYKDVVERLAGRYRVVVRLFTTEAEFRFRLPALDGVVRICSLSSLSRRA